MMDIAMITMIARLLASTNAFAGWLIHLSIAVFAGTGFGILLRERAVRTVPAAVLGVAYGAVWWTLGALWITPANLHMPVFAWNSATQSSLVAHLLFGLLVGLVYATIAQAMAKRPGPAAP